MKRGIGVLLMVLMLAGCSRASESASMPDLSVPPSMLYPEQLSVEYGMTDEEYFAQERAAANHTQWGYVMTDADGSIHDCDDGPHLVWYVTSETYKLKQMGVCVRQLPDGNWTAVEDVTQRGVLVHTEREMWLVTRDGEMEKLFDIPDVSLMRIAVAEPLYYVSFGQDLYRGNLATGAYEKILTVADGRVIVDVKPLSSYRATVATAESDNIYQNWDFSLEYQYNEE